MLSRFKTLLKEPLVHFTVFGLLLFLAYDWFGSKDTGAIENRIVVPASRVEMMISRWTMQLGRPPTEEEVRSLIEGYIREEALSREASALGLDKEDVIIRRRLAQKMEFLSVDMASVEEPDTNALKQFYNDHILNYQVPGEVTFYQVYISTDTRTPLEAQEFARAMLQTLRNEEIDGDRAQEYGDPFMLPNYFPNYSVNDIQGLFGPGNFVEVIFQAEMQQWTGPVQTPYGFHLVYVEAREDSQFEPFSQVQERVYQDYLESRQQEMGEAYLNEIINRYSVEIEGTYADILHEGNGAKDPE